MAERLHNRGWMNIHSCKLPNPFQQSLKGMKWGGRPRALFQELHMHHMEQGTWPLNLSCLQSRDTQQDGDIVMQ